MALETDHQQLGSIDPRSHLAAYSGWLGIAGEHCCWPLNAGPLGGVAMPMNKREAIKRYRALYEGLNAIILEWDPYNLYREGELDDEFSHEVARLLAAVQHSESEADAIDAVQKIFAASFSEHDFSRSSCEEIGRRVFSWWQAQQ